MSTTNKKKRVGGIFILALISPVLLLVCDVFAALQDLGHLATRGATRKIMGYGKYEPTY
jgi:hypothetical protein